MGRRKGTGRHWGGDLRRVMAGTAASFSCGLLFAGYHGYLGLRYGSPWHACIGPFYLLLAAIRGGILLTEQRNGPRTTQERNRCRRRTFRISAVLLLMLDLALMGPIGLMVVLKRPVGMGMIPAIAMAAYTTWKVTMASIRIRRQSRTSGGNPLVAELRTVNFIDALVAVLTLQNTLIMVNGPGDGGMLPFTAASSAVIYAAIVAVTLRMLWKGWNRTEEGP